MKKMTDAAAKARRGLADPKRKTHRRLAEKIDLTGKPWWVKRAYHLRTKNTPRMSYQAIADQLGKTERQVYAALNPGRKEQTDREYEHRNRAVLSERQNLRRRENAPPCDICGEPMSSGRAKPPFMCAQCKQERFEKDREGLIELFRAGWKLKEIDEFLQRPGGWSGANIAVLRKEGVDLPWRHDRPVDKIGRPRSPATFGDMARGRTPANKGRKFPPAPPSDEQIERLITSLSDDPPGWRLQAAIALLWRTGISSTELRQLTVESGDGMINVTEGRWPRSFPIDDVTAGLIRPWVEYRSRLPGDYLFCVVRGPSTGDQWSRAGLIYEITEAVRNAGEPASITATQLNYAWAAKLGPVSSRVLWRLRSLNIQPPTSANLVGSPTKESSDGHRQADVEPGRE